MKKFLFIILFFSASVAFSQDQDANTLHQTAKSFMKQGDYDNSILVLNKALQLQPNDLEITKDLLFSYYLQRNFAKAMEIGKPLVDRPDADVQSFQMLGLTYKAIAEDKEAEKLYKRGLKKFPNEGVLYSEYGDLISAKDPQGAVKLWEQGVTADANYSGNYYFLAKQLAENKDILWSILDAETFLNMESFTARSTEIKNLLLDDYKKFFAGNYVKPPVAETKKGSKKPQPIQFSDAVIEVLNKQQSQLALGITPETLTVIRTRFILDWYDKYAGRFPFRLFEQQKQLLQEGMFEAYNFWLFGPASNLKTYQTWQQFHQDELNAYLGFVRSKVFKVPQGQQYRSM